MSFSPFCSPDSLCRKKNAQAAGYALSCLLGSTQDTHKGTPSSTLPPPSPPKNPNKNKNQKPTVPGLHMVSLTQSLYFEQSPVQTSSSLQSNKSILVVRTPVCYQLCDTAVRSCFLLSGVMEKTKLRMKVDSLKDYMLFTQIICC